MKEGRVREREIRKGGMKQERRGKGRDKRGKERERETE